MVRYQDWTGERKQKCKRGFATKREAQEWERSFQMQTSGEEDVYPPQKAPAAPTVSSRSLFACTWRRLSPEASPIKR